MLYATQFRNLRAIGPIFLTVSLWLYIPDKDMNCILNAVAET